MKVPEGVDLSYPVAHDLLKDIVREFGEDHTYSNPATLLDTGTNGCDYWHDDEDKPGCLIGHALHRLGVPGDWLHGQEGSNAETLLNMLRANYLWNIDQDSTRLFTVAQARQDALDPWGVALKDATMHVDTWGEGSEED